MSGAAENRWSRGGPQQQRQNRQQGQNAAQDRSGTNTPNRQDGNRQSLSAQTGNVWGGQDRGSRSGSATGDRRGTTTPTAPPANDRSKGGAVGGDAYVTAKGFNSAEVKQFLASSYKETINVGSGNPYLKVQGESVKRNSVWGNKHINPKNMANGDNFWNVLSSQIQKAEQGK